MCINIFIIGKSYSYFDPYLDHLQYIKKFFK